MCAVADGDDGIEDEQSAIADNAYTERMSDTYIQSEYMGQGDGKNTVGGNVATDSKE